MDRHFASPYLKAIAMFPKACGALWTGESKYWLDGSHDVLRDSIKVKRDGEYIPTGLGNNECLGVYYPRLVRDGWKLVERVHEARWNDRDIFEKPLGSGWALRKIAHAEVGKPEGKGCYWDEHELVHAGSSTVIPCHDWEWADLDRTRLVWAAGGKLKAASINYDGLCKPQELYNFNPMQFEMTEAPYDS